MDSDQKLEILLAEYNSLRSESLAAINNKLKVLTIGFAGLSVFVGSALSGDLETPTFLLITLGIVPVLAKALLFIWLGEHRRMLRAGGGVQSLEYKINEIAGEALITWEQWLHDSKSHGRLPYLTTIGLLQSASTASILIGVVQWSSINGGETRWWSWLGISCTLIAIAGFECFCLITLKQKWADAKQAADLAGRRNLTNQTQ